MKDRGKNHLPPWLALEIPGDRIEGVWRGIMTGPTSRPHGLLETTEGLRTVGLTSVLQARAARLRDGQPVRVTFEGNVMSAAGRPYRRLAIEPLIEDELPDRPAPAATAPALRPGEQASLPW